LLVVISASSLESNLFTEDMPISIVGYLPALPQLLFSSLISTPFLEILRL